MADTTGGGAAPTWRIVAQQQTVQPGPMGTYTKGIEVFFITGSGVTASVFITEGDYNAQKVRETILARVAQLDTVSGMTG